MGWDFDIRSDPQGGEFDSLNVLNARSVVPRDGNFTYNEDPRVGKLTFQNLKMSNFPWVARPPPPPHPGANH